MKTRHDYDMLISLAQRANQYVHRVLPHGSSNRSKSRTPADEILYNMHAEIDQLEFGLEILNSTDGAKFFKRTYDKGNNEILEPMTRKQVGEFHSQIAGIALKHGAGNCMHMTSVAYDFLKKTAIANNKRVKIEIIYLLKYGHSVLKLSLNKHSIILDPWDDKIYKFSHLIFRNRMYALLKNKHYLFVDSDTGEIAHLKNLSIADMNLDYSSVCHDFAGAETGKIYNSQSNYLSGFFKKAPYLLLAGMLTAAYIISTQDPRSKYVT